MCQLTHYHTITAVWDGIRSRRLFQEWGIVRLRLSQRRGHASCYFSFWDAPRPVWYLRRTEFSLDARLRVRPLVLPSVHRPVLLIVPP